MLELSKEYDFPCVPLSQQAVIAEAIERFNPARNLPHLTIILKKGDVMMPDALHALMELERNGDSISEFFNSLNML